MEFIDTHAHLNFDQFDQDLDDVIKRAEEAKVTKIITIGIDFKTSKRAVELAKIYDGLYASVGFHPHEVKNIKKEDYDLLKELAQGSKVVGIGETGLDYFKEYSPKKLQQEHFGLQVSLAQELDLPVIIHSRNSYEDIIAIIKEVGYFNGVFHCFSGNKTFAKKCLDLGFLISFTGVITFPNAEDIREIVRYVPIDRLLIETDCPFMTPVPFRGKRNEPAYLYHIAVKIAEIKKIELKEVAHWTLKNAREVFRRLFEKEA